MWFELSHLTPHVCSTHTLPPPLPERHSLADPRQEFGESIRRYFRNVPQTLSPRRVSVSQPPSAAAADASANTQISPIRYNRLVSLDVSLTFYHPSHPLLSPLTLPPSLHTPSYHPLHSLLSPFTLPPVTLTLFLSYHPSHSLLSPFTFPPVTYHTSSYHSSHSLLSPSPSSSPITLHTPSLPPSLSPPPESVPQTC